MDGGQRRNTGENLGIDVSTRGKTVDLVEQAILCIVSPSLSCNE